MTQKEFNDFPLLMKPSQARAAFGCTAQTLRDLRAEVPDLGIRLPGMEHWRYRKRVVAKLLNLAYE